jgi:hypothetical protein
LLKHRNYTIDFGRQQDSGCNLLKNRLRAATWNQQKSSKIVLWADHSILSNLKPLQTRVQNSQHRAVPAFFCRDAAEFDEKLGYIHLNPVKRVLVKDPAEWEWTSVRHYSLREVGRVGIESEWTAHDREMLASGGTARLFLGAPGKTSQAALI